MSDFCHSFKTNASVKGLQEEFSAAASIAEGFIKGLCVDQILCICSFFNNNRPVRADLSLSIAYQKCSLVQNYLMIYEK